MRLIDADALIELLEPHGLGKGSAIGWHSGIIDTVIDEISKMPTIGGWISVEDQVPENEQYVILWTKTGVMKYAKYLDDEPHRPWIAYDEYGSIRAWDNVVTHWMPMPEPPEEVTGDAD